MSTIITYLGPSTEVYVPALGAAVKRGKSIEVTDRDIAKSLLAQEGTWAKASDDARKED